MGDCIETREPRYKDKDRDTLLKGFSFVLECNGLLQSSMPVAASMTKNCTSCPVTDTRELHKILNLYLSTKFLACSQSIPTKTNS